MSVTPKEAAELVGMSKQGIIRAIHKGKLSATRNVHGNFEIDRAELFRAYTPLSTETKTSVSVDSSETTYQIKSLQEKVTMLERMIDDKNDTIQKLFAALEAQQQVTLLLEDKQPKPFWSRWLKGR